MTKHSQHERARRAAETERMNEVQAAWYASVPRDVLASFESDVASAHAKGPLPPPPNQAPGTRPNPPRPGREPKAAKEERGGSRSRG